MKAVIRTLTLFLLASSGSIACVGQDPGSANIKQFATVKIQTSCEAMADTRCLGHFGFTADHEGNFTAGPGPSGNVVHGTITSEELRMLTESVEAQIASGEVLTCHGHGVAGLTNQISASLVDGTKIDLFTSGLVPKGVRAGSECFVGDRKKAGEVRDIVHRLLAKYYPLPFPSS